MTTRQELDLKTTGIANLLEIMARLRNPQGGCPWDLEQTFATIAPYTIEEAFEVADAIARGNIEDLKEELGDLLLQVVFHSQIAEEAGLFKFEDVVEAISNKMIRRHPHVFGDGSASSLGEVRKTWEAIKAEEKVRKNNGGPSRYLDDVPSNLPALMQAVKLTSRAAKVGFDWPDVPLVLKKLAEEIGELQHEVLAEPAAKEKIEDELGDVLFVLANLARKLDIDPESAVRGTNQKFTERFHRIEELLEAKGKQLSDSDLEEMDKLWDQAKAELRKQGGR